MASEPYWAEAPSRSTSTCRRAIDGMVEMSGPCVPSVTPPNQTRIAERWRRLPLTSTSVGSWARLRRLAGRTSEAAPLVGWVATLNEGTRLRNR